MSYLQLCSRLYSIEIEFLLIYNKKSLFEDLGVKYALNLYLVGKPVVDFLFVVIELLSLSLLVQTL